MFPWILINMMDLDLMNFKVIKQNSLLHERNKSTFDGLWLNYILNFFSTLLLLFF